jgi:hypothetical protein
MTVETGAPITGRSASTIIVDDPVIPTRQITQPIVHDINTLSKDIYHVLDASKDHVPDSALAAQYAMAIGGEFAKATLKRDRPREKGKLWASDLGKRCLRQAYYNFNEPEHGEKLNGHTKFKFLYGNILEEAVLYFAEEAGHRVANPQHQVELKLSPTWTIRGRIDAVLDGHLVDVKSTSSFGFKRYKEGIDVTNDSFGYLEQLGFYSHFNDIDPKPKEGGFVWIDKQNGHIQYTPVTVPSKDALLTKARAIVEAVDKPEQDVDRGYSPEPYGKSGNLKLPVGCAYCPFKARCYRDSNSGRGLRGFIYNQGPVWFTDVQREPRKTVLEIKT